MSACKGLSQFLQKVNSSLMEAVQQVHIVHEQLNAWLRGIGEGAWNNVKQSIQTCCAKAYNFAPVNAFLRSEGEATGYIESL